MKIEIPFTCMSCSAGGKLTLEMDPSSAAKIPAERRKKERREPLVTTPFFQEVVAHITEKWEKKKSAKFHWEPKFFKPLKGLIKTYQPWGVMALYDLYINMTDDWARQTGYSFPGFIAKIPQLVDFQWKGGAMSYETKLIGSMGQEIADVLKNVTKGVPHVAGTNGASKVDPQRQVRLSGETNEGAVQNP